MKKLILLGALSVLFYSAPGYTGGDQSKSAAAKPTAAEAAAAREAERKEKLAGQQYHEKILAAQRNYEELQARREEILAAHQAAVQKAAEEEAPKEAAPQQVKQAVEAYGPAYETRMLARAQVEQAKKDYEQAVTQCDEEDYRLGVVSGLYKKMEEEFKQEEKELDQTKKEFNERMPSEKKNDDWRCSRLYHIHERKAQDLKNQLDWLERVTMDHDKVQANRDIEKSKWDEAQKKLEQAQKELDQVTVTLKQAQKEKVPTREVGTQTAGDPEAAE